MLGWLEESGGGKLANENRKTVSNEYAGMGGISGATLGRGGMQV